MTTVNPQIRKPNRWREYNYSSEGAYFITICSYKREILFGDISNEVMVLNDYGKIVADNWLSIPERYSQITLGAHQIMPNHFHGIVLIGENVHPVVATHELPLRDEEAYNSLQYLKERRGMLLSKVIGYFKMNSAKQINIQRETYGTSVWQKSFHDRVIRDYEEYCRIEKYIYSNPAHWITDKENPLNP